jgi:hypothetical protein
METAVMTTTNNNRSPSIDNLSDEDGQENSDNQVDQLLRSVFQMCDVTCTGQISVEDLLTLGRQYLGQDTKVSQFQSRHARIE